MIAPVVFQISMFPWVTLALSADPFVVTAGLFCDTLDMNWMCVLFSTYPFDLFSSTNLIAFLSSSGVWRCMQ